MEFSRMAKHMNIHVNLFFCILCGSVLFTVGFLHNYINYKDGYLYFFLLTFIMSICELYRKRGNGFQNIAFSYYALLYISLPFTLLIYLPYMTSGKWMPEIIFFPFLLVWVNDTFAYLSGSLLGKHKLFPRISPKKSWEGAIGGGLMTIIVGLCVSPYIEGYTIRTLPLFHVSWLFSGYTGIYWNPCLNVASRSKIPATYYRDTGAFWTDSMQLYSQFPLFLFIWNSCINFARCFTNVTKLI